jgi:hypothetical protein
VRRAAKVDANQAQIVQALRAAGASVHSLASLGRGMPDLLVGYGGKTALMEVKDGAGQLRPLQEAFAMNWHGGTLATVRDVEGALRVLAVMTGSVK